MIVAGFLRDLMAGSARLVRSWGAGIVRPQEAKMPRTHTTLPDLPAPSVYPPSTPVDVCRVSDPGVRVAVVAIVACAVALAVLACAAWRWDGPADRESRVERLKEK